MLPRDSNMAAALFGRTQRVLLGLLFCRSDESFYLNEIVRKTGAGMGAVQREIACLLNAGLITRTRRGNLVLYQANRACPLFAPLREIMVKTTGVADVLRAALAPLSDRIRVAFIYGSIAKGEETATSDLDVLIVGDLTFGDLVCALRSSQDVLGREVNPTVYPLAELKARAAGGSSFITTIMAEPKVFLIGNEHEFRSLAA